MPFKILESFYMQNNKIIIISKKVLIKFTINMSDFMNVVEQNFH